MQHKLRNELIVVREGISQVLEGLGAKDCEKCCAILVPALAHVDKIYKLLDTLFDATGCTLERKDEESEIDSDHSAEDDLKILKNEYIDRIAHLVRTPLCIANEALSLALDGILGEMDPKQKDIIALSRKNLQRLNNSIEQILNTPWDSKIDISAHRVPHGVKFENKNK